MLETKEVIQVSAIVHSSKPSPRIENGVLYFVEGDTFQMMFELDLFDGDHEPVVIDDGTFHFTIIDDRENVVTTIDIDEYTQPQEGGLENAVFFPIDFDSTLTSKMYKGRYYYTITYDYTMVYDPEDESQNQTGTSTKLYRNLLIVE